MVAKEFKDGIDEIMHAAMRPLETSTMLRARCAAREQERRDTMVDPEGDDCPVMIHVDVRRAYFHAMAEPNTLAELLEEDQMEKRLKQSHIRTTSRVHGILE